MKNSPQNPSTPASPRALKLLQLGLCVEDLFELNDPLEVCQSLGNAMSIMSSGDHDLLDDEIVQVNHVLQCLLKMIVFSHDYRHGRHDLHHLNYIVFEEQPNGTQEDVIREGKRVFDQFFNEKLGEA